MVMLEETEKLAAAISLLYSMPCRRIVSLKNEKVFLLTTDQGDFVLKLLPYPGEEMAFITQAMTYLKHRDFHSFNEIIPTVHGSKAPAYHNGYLLLTKKCSGRIASFQCQSDVEKCSGWLGRMHNAAAGFQANPCYEQRNKWGKMIDAMEAGIAALYSFRQGVLTKTEKDEFDCGFLRLYPDSLKRAKAAVAKLTPFYAAFSTRAQKNGGFCHHDPAHHNFLINDGEKEEVSAVDFDYAIADTAAHDVAALLLKVLKANRFQPIFALKALDAYQSRRILSSEENRFIDALLTYPYDFHRAAFARYAESDQSHRIERKMRHLGAEKEATATAIEKLSQKLREEP